MPSRAWIALGGFAVLVLALLAGHFNLDQVVSGGVVTAGRIVVGAIGAAMLVGAAVTLPAKHRPPHAGLLLLSAALVLLAIYLPELRFGDGVKWLFDTANVDAGEEGVALTWARCVLAAGALALLVATRFRFALELAVGVVSALILIAGVAATADALTNLDSPPAESATREAAFDRGFVLPVAKLQPVARDLARDSCVDVKVVTATDPDTSDDQNALVYETRSYPARLVAAVKAGKPSSPVTVELATADDRFASDLFSAAAIHLLSTAAAQADGAACP